MSVLEDIEEGKRKKRMRKRRTEKGAVKEEKTPGTIELLKWIAKFEGYMRDI